MELLKEALNASWCRETAYRTDQPYWSEANKTRGQCTVTVMILNDYFGGQMMRGFSEKYKLYHYWIIIDDNKIDLTFEQFIGDKDDIVFDKVVPKTKDDLMRIWNVKKRYYLLKQRVEGYLANEQ
jgi:hypothetical protein